MAITLLRTIIFCAAILLPVTAHSASGSEFLIVDEMLGISIYAFLASIILSVSLALVALRRNSATWLSVSVYVALLGMVLAFVRLMMEPSGSPLYSGWWYFGEQLDISGIAATRLLSTATGLVFTIVSTIYVGLAVSLGAVFAQDDSWIRWLAIVLIVVTVIAVLGMVFDLLGSFPFLG